MATPVLGKDQLESGVGDDLRSMVGGWADWHAVVVLMTTRVDDVVCGLRAESLQLTEQTADDKQHGHGRDTVCDTLHDDQRYQTDLTVTRRCGRLCTRLTNQWISQYNDQYRLPN